MGKERSYVLKVTQEVHNTNTQYSYDAFKTLVNLSLVTIG